MATNTASDVRVTRHRNGRISIGNLTTRQVDDIYSALLTQHRRWEERGGSGPSAYSELANHILDGAYPSSLG